MTTTTIDLTLGGDAVVRDLPHDAAVRVPIGGGHVVVDAQDLDLVGRFSWRVLTTPAGRTYAAAYSHDHKTQTVYLHRLIAETSVGMETDHINGDGLDNRRANLRDATSSQNKANRPARPHTSRYKGVSWDKRRGYWAVYLTVDGRTRNLGRYDDEQEAARVYDAAAHEHYGSFAVLNFPKEVAR